MYLFVGFHMTLLFVLYVCIRERREKQATLTSDTPDVVVELLLQSVGGVLLPRKVLQVLVEYVVGRPVHLAQVL